MSISQTIIGQFKQPHGLLGQLAGVIMANRSSNIERNAWTLDLLALKPTDRVLEIGFVNVVQFWDNPVAVFQALRPSLSTGGVIATTYMPRHSGATNADASKKADEIMAHLRTAGLNTIRVEEKSMKPVSAVCVLATRT